MKKPVPLTPQALKISTNNHFTSVSEEIERVGRTLMDRDYSDHSREAIRADIRSFLQWFGKKNGQPFSFSALTERDIADFRDDCRREGLAVKTVNRRLVFLRRFLDAAVQEGILTRNPAKNVRQLRSQPLAPKSLTPQETRKFLKEVELRGSLRDRVLVELMVGAGLRISEVVALTVDDLQLSPRKGLVIIRNAKGNKERRVPLHRNIRALLSEYLSAMKPTKNLFSGQRVALTSVGIHALIRKFGTTAGLPKLHAHTLRHTFAMNFLRSNPGGLQQLSQLLGHSSLTATSVYVQHRVEELEEGIERMTY